MTWHRAVSISHPHGVRDEGYKPISEGGPGCYARIAPIAEWAHRPCHIVHQEQGPGAHCLLCRLSLFRIDHQFVG
jgi:hypothetical protein